MGLFKRLINKLKSESSSSSSTKTSSSPKSSSPKSSSSNKTAAAAVATTATAAATSTEKEQELEQEQESPDMSQQKVAIIIYSLYGHIGKLAESVKVGVASAGGVADIYQVAETLPAEILEKMHAPPKPDYPIATPDVLKEYGSFLFGVPTRYGNMPSQMKSFIDSTGGLWASGALYHKPAGVFVSTGTGGGNEMTVVSMLSTLAHHGMVFVPLGYAEVFAKLTNLEEVHGGSPWGAGTIAGPDGSRQPTELELEIAEVQGKAFFDAASKLTK
ncbi:unnamed protein product [[Candida] boidinii]|uniref:Unnamed protein product n=1 Tax=Candida boidinii TaxID=5477 RepID=A0A9W6WGD3_CANBO|nr:FMN binding protein [[Candida] boidinii]GME69289.1 unnamed protein product [[Candida] boidinii]GMF98054.1 unnamed protein product [[Candida] boidinii]